MIGISGLRVRHPGSTRDAVAGVTTTISHPAFIAIMGPNGAGKSTLARCLNALITPTAGTVTIDGLDTGEPSVRHEIRRRVGMVFTDPNLQMTSISVERELAFGLQNMGIPMQEIRSRVDDQLRLFGLDHLRANPPLTLSGGEKQRLALAAVTIVHPAYLVLDEATSLLSADSRRGVMHLVLEMRQRLGCGLIIITQFPAEALAAERLLIMHRGTVLMDGAPPEVFADTRRLVEIGVPVPVRSRLMEFL